MSIISESDSNTNIYKNGYDYDDCCCGEECSCGGGHNRIELVDKMNTISEFDKASDKDNNNNTNNNREIEELNTGENTVIQDGIRIHDINNIVIENLILDQSDMNIPLIALRIGVILLIGLIIEVCNA
jgi:hypothetical protein